MRNEQINLPSPRKQERVIRVGQDALLVTVHVSEDEVEEWGDQAGRQMWLCAIDGSPVTCLARWGSEADAPSAAEVEALLTYARTHYPTWFFPRAHRPGAWRVTL